LEKHCETPVHAVLTNNNNIGVLLAQNDRLLIADIEISDFRGIWTIGKFEEAEFRSFDFRNP
jgi:hypothetical protein